MSGMKLDTTNMNWDNLKRGTCPTCDEVLYQPGGREGSMVECKYCPFKIKLAKYTDLIKGKQSNAYKNRVADICRRRAFEKKREERKRTIGVTAKKKYGKKQDDERRHSLNLMLRRGLITKAEFDMKMAQFA